MDQRGSDLKVQQLRRIPSLASCEDRELSALSNLVDQCTFPAGAVITTETRYGVETFIIVEGTAEVSIGGHIINYIGTGGFIGEMSSIDSGLRSTTTIALTSIDALVVGPRGFALMLERSCFNRAVMRNLVERLRHHDERLLAESTAMNQADGKSSAQGGTRIQVIR